MGSKKSKSRVSGVEFRVQDSGVSGSGFTEVQSRMDVGMQSCCTLVLERGLNALSLHGAAGAGAHLSRTKEGRDLGRWPLASSKRCRAWTPNTRTWVLQKVRELNS